MLLRPPFLFNQGQVCCRQPFATPVQQVAVLAGQFVPIIDKPGFMCMLQTPGVAATGRNSCQEVFVIHFIVSANTYSSFAGVGM